MGCAQKTEDTEKHPGQDRYVQYCAACHNVGVADAPKLGEMKQWRWRIDKGREVLLENTINGMPPGMPKRGLCMSCSDKELVDAIDYMLDALD